MSTPTPGQDRKFGALLHTKRLPVINAVVLSPLVLAFLYLALTQPFSAASAGVLAVSVLLGALIVWTLSYRAWIHDLGVRTSSAFGKRELLYKDLRTFSYSRISYNGQVTDTLTFIPQSGKPVRVAVQPRGQDADLARIVNVLAERAAARMEQELTRQKRVRWLTHAPRALPAQPGVLLTRDAFVVDSGKSPTTIPFGEIEVRIDGGNFMAKDRATGKVRLQAPCAAPNFYAGLALYQKLVTQAPADAPALSPTA
ncbi:MAG: hypothetical protein U0133_14665 [Gemmatimonadales bacterium]